MTNVSYNNVLLQDVLTEDIDQVPHYDQSGADMLFVKVRVRVSAIVHTLQTYTLGSSGGNTLAKSLNDIIAKLSVPRRRFLMTIGGQTLFDVLPGAVPAGGGPVAQNLNNMDCDNGPKPNVKVLSIIGEATARISFEIEVNVPACAGSGNGILNLRFWIADDIDCKTWLTTRTYHGRLRLAHNHLNPHAFRNFVVPPVQPGFQADSISLQGSEDGLELEFTVRHQEHWAQAPGPATDWEGSHMISSPMVGGQVGESEVRIKLRGPKSVDKGELIATAMKILNAKLHFADMASENSVMLLYAAINDNLKENEVEATARVKHVGKYSLFNMADNTFGFPLKLPNYDKEIAKPGSPTATTAGLFLCALQTACKPGVIGQPSASDGTITKFEYKGPTTTIPAATVANLLPYETRYSQDHQKFMYMNYQESNEYRVDEGLIALPFAVASSDQKKNKDTCKFVQLFPPQAKRIVRISAERLGKWPDMPNPQKFTDDYGIVHWPEDWRPMPHASQLSADGRKELFTSDFEITYALSRKPTPKESFRVGRIPIRSPNGSDGESSTLPESVFVDQKKIV